MSTKVVVTKQDLGNTLKLDTKNKKIQVNTGDGINVSKDGVLSVEGGLSVDSINKLPIEYWKKGTTVLAKQNDELVRIRSLSDLFQDVGIGVNSSNYRFEINKPNRVTVTVTNSGNNTAENVNITVNKPSGDYTITNESNSGNGATGIKKNNPLEYTISKITPSGNFKITFDINSTKSGETYKFDFQATVDGVETNAKNNKTSIILNSFDPKPPESNYEPTIDCPLINAFYIDGSNGSTQKKLVTYSDIWKIGGSETGRYMNVINTGNGIQGKKFKLQGASTVVATTGIDMQGSRSYQSSKISVYDDRSYLTSNAGYNVNSRSANGKTVSRVISSVSSSTCTHSFSESGKLIVGDINNALALYESTNGSNLNHNEETREIESRPDTIPGSDNARTIIDAGTFDVNTGIFTIHDDLADKNPSFSLIDKKILKEKPITLWMRPQGNDCRWQCVTLIPTIQDPELFPPMNKKTFDNIRVTKGKAVINIDKNLFLEEKRWSVNGKDDTKNFFYTSQANWVGNAKPSDLDAFYSNISRNSGTYLNERKRARLNSSFTVTVKKGQEAVIEFDYYDGNDTPQALPSKFNTSGNTSISKNPTDDTKGIITISANATTTDSINLNEIEVIITD